MPGHRSKVSARPGQGPTRRGSVAGREFVIEEALAVAVERVVDVAEVGDADGSREVGDGVGWGVSSGLLGAKVVGLPVVGSGLRLLDAHCLQFAQLERRCPS